MPEPRLIVTLGPASYGLARRMADAGADAFRLNASHLRPEELAARVADARAAAPRLPVVVDLQGAKMRIGEFEPRAVRDGDTVVFGAGGVPLPHPELFASVARGETLSVHDGRLLFEITAVAADRITTRCRRGGRLAPRKGANLLEHPVSLRALTAADAAAIAAGAGAGAAEFAFSFMEDGREAAWVRAAAPPGARVSGKVERAEAVAALGAIAAACDDAWICRGDLGAQLGPAGLARAVAAIDPRAHARPLLMAGQVLQSLTRQRDVTRSEVCHVHDLLARGFAGIVLSDETAVGQHPIEAVAAARALLRALSAPGGGRD